ncbi:hypothetical protein PGT21_007113 [Puccinia graminis f. sp. tritici]|uniref:Uncharacterized protein n=1 Tax=Puccinia graminis f. sp. tritici TaxID=56615 RepID=A0A5B0NXF6_PUCGR|nr:hypothetical protein PGT21_007113 [Puccinia graminis f. sp. tritici]KAA1093653.1 hypothetical protein PGTUg99_016913 [Puccinia graminis f. sp. tritici]
MEAASKITRSKATVRKDTEPNIRDAQETATQKGAALTPRESNPTKESGRQPNDSEESDGEESVDLITKNPILSADNLKEAIEITSIPPETKEVDQRSHIWEQLKLAQANGDKILAKILLAAYNELEPNTATSPKLTRSTSALPILANTEFTKGVELSEAKTELEDNLVYAVGAVTSHQDIGFTPYFDENIKKLRAPLPLTIFDREWQKKALTAHLMAKPSKSSEDKAYRGLPYHDEWTQSHSAWTNNHRSFYITLRDVYNKGLFAEKLRIHKENCDSIADVYGFMTAFRYDMQIRMNAFAHRVPTKDGAAVPDISVKQMVVVEQCYSTVRSFGEASWKDNNYAPGFLPASFEPDTGVKKPELVKAASYQSGYNRESNGGTHRMNHQERRREKRWGGGSQEEYNRNSFNNNFPGNYGNQGYGPYTQNYSFKNQFGNKTAYEPQFNQNQNHFNPYGQNYASHSQGPSDSRKRFRGGSGQVEDGSGKSAGVKDGQVESGNRKQ